MNHPAPEKEGVLSWPTPDIRDVIVWRMVDMKLPKNKEHEYGDPHPDVEQYPDYKLVWISPQSGNKFARLFYHKERSDQDNYNFTYSQCDIGGRRFDVATRAYLKLRADFNEAAFQAGTAMPADPDDKFLSKGYVLMTREVIRANNELDSLFVAEQQTYIKKVSITNLGFDELSGRNLASIMTWYYRGEFIDGFGLVEDLFDDTNHDFWGVDLISEPSFYTGFTISGQSVPALDSDYELVGTFSSPTLLNGKVYYTNDGNALSGTTATIVYYDGSRWNISTVTAGVPDSAAWYSQDEIEFPYNATTWVSGLGSPTGTVNFTNGLGNGYGLGVVRTGDQLSDDWFLVTDRGVISGAEVEGGLLIRSYQKTINYFWPPVLNVLEFMDWLRLDGGTDIFPRVEMNPEGYSGPCSALVEVYWSIEPQVLLTQQMDPRAISYASPFFRLNIPPCLHVAVVAYCDIGSSDQVYAVNSGSARTFPATEYTTWPDQIIADDDQEPSRGGFLRTKVTVYPPDHATPPTISVHGYPPASS